MLKMGEWSFTKLLRREEDYVGKRVIMMEVPGGDAEEVPSGSGWVTSGTTCRKEDCKGMKHNARLTGSVSLRYTDPSNEDVPCRLRDHRTLHHNPLSAMEVQRVALMDLGTLDQLWTQMARKAEAIDVGWYLEEKTVHAI